MAKPDVPVNERVISLLLAAVLVVMVCRMVVWPIVIAKNTGQTPQAKSPYRLPGNTTLIEQWIRLSADRIYEKIDGRDALFLDYDIQHLDFASVSINKQPFDIYIYVMKDPKGAIEVYKEEQPKTYKPLTIAAKADLSAGVVRACQRNIYLVILPLEKNNDETLALKLATSIIKGIKQNARQ